MLDDKPLCAHVGRGLDRRRLAALCRPDQHIARGERAGGCILPLAQHLCHGIDIDRKAGRGDIIAELRKQIVISAAGEDL